MMRSFCRLASLLTVVGLLRLADSPAGGQVFTVQVGSAAPPPTPLVNHGDTWRYHKGTNSPGIGWQTRLDTALDATWLSGPGGFGYEDDDDATILTDMIDRYTTLYIRRTFEIGALPDPGRRLQLVMDWDDAFVAWLDGVEIARSRNAPGAVGSEPNFDAVSLAPNHEASAGVGGNPPTTYDLGPVGERLAPGPHVLAILGLNARNSSDFSLIADLSLVGGQGAAESGVYFSLIKTNIIQLSGSNTFAGAARVTVNAEDAAFDAASRTWTKTLPATPGMNRLFIASHDAEGNILAATNRDVVAELATQFAGGPIAGSQEWHPTNGVVRLTSSVTVTNSGRLFIRPGTVVLLGPNQSLRADGRGSIRAGLAGEPLVYFLPADGSTAWGQLSANGTNALVELNDSEVVAGQLRVTAGAALTLIRAIVRELYARQILEGVNGGGLEIHNSHFLNYAQAHVDFTPTVIHNSLFENITSDAMDFAGAPAPIRVSYTTWRNGFGANTDAIDLGDNLGVEIAGCLIHHFPDKGISIADNAHRNMVASTLIHHCGSGLSVYASSNNTFFNNTIYACSNSLRLYERTAGQGAGFATAHSMIIWGNTNGVSVENGSQLDLTYSDTQGGVFPGTGNISADPLFANAAAGDYYTLATNSPARDAGRSGVDMGADPNAPVNDCSIFGGLLSAPEWLAALPGIGHITLTWRDTSDNECGFVISQTGNGATSAFPVPANTTSVVLSNRAPNVPYEFQIKAVGARLESKFSNIARAAAREQKVVVGGVLPTSATWSPANGPVCVVSNLIVPTNVTLRIEPGTIVRVTNNMSIIAAGGVIEIAGTEDNKVHLQPMITTNIWGQLSAQFGGSLTLRHADVSGAQVTVYSNAVGLLEDSFIHDYRRAGGSLFAAPIILTHFAAHPVIVRRCHVREYHETLWRNGVTIIEDSLFENVHGDGVDFDAAQPGTSVRRCTFRHGNSGNVDALDVGPADLGGSRNVFIADCLMYDFPFDKGVSCGDAPNPSTGTIVSNCLIYGCLSGVMAKDNSFVSVVNCTIADNNWGFTNYNKANQAAPTGGGHTTNSYNNILWNNGITISMANAGTLTADHNLLGHTNWPGLGNFDADPRFVNAAQRDYRLATNSPALSVGRDSARLGARFPVGAAMAPSHPVIGSFGLSGGNLVLEFWADSERTYTLQSADAVIGATWANVTNIAQPVNPQRIKVSLPRAAAQRFYRLVSPQR